MANIFYCLQLEKQAATLVKMSVAQAQRAEEECVLREAQLACPVRGVEQKRIEQIRYEKEQKKKILKNERKVPALCDDLEPALRVHVWKKQKGHRIKHERVAGFSLFILYIL